MIPGLPAPEAPKKNSDAVESARKIYGDRSGTASTLTRGLAAGGLALVLVLGGATKDFEAGKIVDLSNGLIVAAVLLLLALFSDITQYVWGAAAFAIWARYWENAAANAENEANAAEFVDPTPAVWPAWMNYPSLVLFWLKIVLVLIGYVILLYYMAFQVR